jgi:hypothetical protein
VPCRCTKLSCTSTVSFTSVLLLGRDVSGERLQTLNGNQFKGMNWDDKGRSAPTYSWHCEALRIKTVPLTRLRDRAEAGAGGTSAPVRRGRATLDQDKGHVTLRKCIATGHETGNSESNFCFPFTVGLSTQAASDSAHLARSCCWVVLQQTRSGCCSRTQATMERFRLGHHCHATQSSHSVVNPGAHVLVCTACIQPLHVTYSELNASSLPMNPRS